MKDPTGLGQSVFVLSLGWVGQIQDNFMQKSMKKCQKIFTQTGKLNQLPKEQIIWKKNGPHLRFRTNHFLEDK